MRHTAGIAKDYCKHFLLDETKLRKVCDVIREHAGKLPYGTYIRFRINRENDSFYETTDLDEVFADDNAIGRSLSVLGLELHKEDEEGEENPVDPPEMRRALVIVVFSRLGNEKVDVIVQGENRDWCFIVADDIDSQIQRSLRPRSLLGKLPGRLIDPAVFVIVAGLLILGATLVQTSLSPALTADEIQVLTAEEQIAKILELVCAKTKRSELILPVTFLVTSCLMMILVFRPIHHLVKRSDRSVFYWGDVIPLHDAFEKRIARIKWGIGVGFIVSLIATIVGGIMLR